MQRSYDLTHFCVKIRKNDEAEMRRREGEADIT